MAGTIKVNPTSDQDTNGLLSGVKWDTRDLTFSFPTDGRFYGIPYERGENTNNFAPLNATQSAAARTVFGMIAAVTNVTFREITESDTTHAILRLAKSDTPEPDSAYTYFPSNEESGGDSWFRNTGGPFDNPVRGNEAWFVFMHEIGHGLGLKHGHEELPGSDWVAMTTLHDSMEFSVMTYRSYVGAPPFPGGNEAFGFAQTLMMYDIAALQHMYGADLTTSSGDTTYRWSPTTGQTFINGISQGTPGANRIFMTVWDGDGNDTYDFSNYTTNLSVNLIPGEWTRTSPAQLAILRDSRIARGNIANALLFNGDPRSLIKTRPADRGTTGLRAIRERMRCPAMQATTR